MVARSLRGGPADPEIGATFVTSVALVHFLVVHEGPPSPPPEDARLVERLRAGDVQAFDVLYRRYERRLAGFVARLHGRREGLEDVLQETWLRLAQNAGRLRPDTQLLPWLFTVARNLVIGRHRWRILDADRLFAWSRMTAADNPTPFDLHLASEAERRLELALLELPLKYREVLLLVAVEGLSQKDAAAVLDLTHDAARQRLARARQMMQALLEAP